MKSILIPIKPKWTAKILNGEKTAEIRKTAPKEWVDYLSGKTAKKPEPMFVYIYCTKGDYIGRISKKYVGKVVARFTLNEVEKIFMSVINHYQYETNTLYEDELLKQSLLNGNELDTYLKNKHYGYAWHISDLEIFDEPKELNEFYSTRLDKDVTKLFDNSIQLSNGKWVKRLDKAPQSWCYVEEGENAK